MAWGGSDKLEVARHREKLATRSLRRAAIMRRASSTVCTGVLRLSRSQALQAATRFDSTFGPPCELGTVWSSLTDSSDSTSTVKSRPQ